MQQMEVAQTGRDKLLVRLCGSSPPHSKEAKAQRSVPATEERSSEAQGCSCQQAELPAVGCCCREAWQSLGEPVTRCCLAITRTPSATPLRGCSAEQGWKSAPKGGLVTTAPTQGPEHSVAVSTAPGASPRPGYPPGNTCRTQPVLNSQHGQNYTHLAPSLPQGHVKCGGGRALGSAPGSQTPPRSSAGSQHSLQTLG